MAKLNDKNIPQSITEIVLKYLEEQELAADEDEGYGRDHDSGLLHVRSVLDQIIANIAERAQLIEDFQARLKAHNQYPLFDLSTIIPEFHLDDALYEKLTFRETLVVSYINSNDNPLVPKVVGGLCLDVQKAKGKNPMYRKDVGLEQKIIKLITFKANALRQTSNVSNQSDPHDVKGSTADLLSKSELKQLTQSNEELEQFVTSIMPQYERTECKFLVHVSSQFDADGHNAGSRITAWVDRNFHTLEEKRTEFYMENDTSLEKTLYCALQPRRYYVKHTSTFENITDRKYYSMGKTRDLVCEGANFVLMRYLAVSRYMGKFELSTMYINGDMCRNIYECLGPESGLVNGQKLDLCKIYRTVMEECGITHHCITVLTLCGQIIKQEWNDCDYVLQVNPLAYIGNESPYGNERLFLEKVWETDMQLFSNFLDSKTACVLKIKSYLADHPEFQNMMADFVKSTLLMKPEDVLNFTIKHFTQYYPQSMRRYSNFPEE